MIFPTKMATELLIVIVFKAKCVNSPTGGFLGMQLEADVMLARKKVFLAEEALYAMMHSHEYSAEESRRLAKEVATARDNLLDQLAQYWKEN
jgi:hypothetical protein